MDRSHRTQLLQIETKKGQEQLNKGKDELEPVSDSELCEADTLKEDDFGLVSIFLDS